MKTSADPPASPLRDLEEERLRYYRERVRQHESPHPQFHAPSVDALVTLVDAHHVIWTALSRALAEHDISPSALNLLGILKRCDSQGCPLGELSGTMLVTPPGITGLVDSLVRRGLVERRVHEHDRRVRLACITAAGTDLIERVLPSHFAMVRTLCSSLSESELTELANLLARLSHGIRQQGAPTGECDSVPAPADPTPESSFP